MTEGCALCGRKDPAARPAPRAVANLISLALAFGHGGMWAQEILANPLCRRCRRLLVPAALCLAALVFTGAVLGARLILRR